MANVEHALKAIAQEVTASEDTGDVELLQHYVTGFGIQTPLRSLLDSSANIAEQALLWEVAWRHWAWIAGDEGNPDWESRFSNPFLVPEPEMARALDLALSDANDSVGEFLKLCQHIELSSDWPRAERAAAVASSGFEAGEMKALAGVDEETLFSRHVISRAIFRGNPDVVIRCSESILAGFFKTRPQTEDAAASEFLEDVAPLLLLCYCRIRETPSRLLTTLANAFRQYEHGLDTLTRLLSESRSSQLWWFGLPHEQPIRSRQWVAERAYFDLQNLYVRTVER